MKAMIRICALHLLPLNTNDQLLAKMQLMFLHISESIGFKSSMYQGLVLWLEMTGYHYKHPSDASIVSNGPYFDTAIARCAITIILS